MRVHQNINTVGPIEFIDSYKGGTYDIPSAFSDEEMKVFYSLCDGNYKGNHLIYHDNDTVNVIFALYAAYMLASDKKKRTIYYIGKHWDTFYYILNAFIENGSFEYTTDEEEDEDTECIKVENKVRVKHIKDYNMLYNTPIFVGSVFIFECSHLNSELLDELTYIQRVLDSQVIMAGKHYRESLNAIKENPNFFNLKVANREYSGERYFELFHSEHTPIFREDMYKEKFNEMLRDYISKITKTNK